MPFSDYFKKKGKDIQLPNESGRVDSRLPNKGQAEVDRLRIVGKKLGTAHESLKALKKYKSK